MVWTRVRGKRVVVGAVWSEFVSGSSGAISLFNRENTGNLVDFGSFFPDGTVVRPRNLWG